MRTLSAVPIRHLVRDLGRRLPARQWAAVALKIEAGLYYWVVAPAVAFLPAPVAYRVACLRGDLRYAWDASLRDQLLRNLETVLGIELTPDDRARVVRDYLRLAACRPIDLLRLAGKGQSLLRLTEFRGLEHLDAALAAGRGAILASAHFGSYVSASSILGARGYRITVMNRPLAKVGGGRSTFRWLLWGATYRVLRTRHRSGQDIEPWEGDLTVAVRAAQVLRRNEVIVTMLDPYVLEGDRKRAIQVDFLNGQADLLPGAVTLAQLTGAPLFIMLMHRSSDWYHQILEISPAVPVNGAADEIFSSCVARIDAAIRREPAHWMQWRTHDLEQLGLLPSASSASASTDEI